MSKCKFTIITVCYNAKEHIATTVQSVLSQSYENFEYIIKDGQSCDGTMDIVHNLTDSDNRVMIIQGKDQGIYDAMNTAVLQSSGEYILFLNAGDILHQDSSLEEIAGIINRENADVYYGNIYQVTYKDNMAERFERVYSQNSIKKVQFAIGRCICHQAIFARKELFLDKKFDTRFKVCADREWQLYHLSRGHKFLYLPIVVSDVLVDGYSMRHVDELEKEVLICVQKYCKQYLWIYNSIMFFKKSVFLKKILQRLDSLSATRKKEVL